MKIYRSLVVSAAFLALAVVLAVWLYPRLPVQVPSHWNLQDQVDGHLSRWWAAAMPPLLIASLAAITVLLPAISPRKFEIGPFVAVYVLLMLAIQAFMLVVGAALLLAAAGYPVSVPRVVMLAVGALLMVLGNYMGKLRRNFFVGIRTPWTLSSNSVWERTHRLGGWLFMLAGVVVIFANLAGAPMWLSVIAIAAAALIPCAYSFVVYRRIERVA